MEIELEGKRYVRREGEDTEQRSKQGMGRCRSSVKTFRVRETKEQALNGKQV